MWPLLAAASVAGRMAFFREVDGDKGISVAADVEKGMVELFHKHVLWGDIVSSLRRVAWDFALPWRWGFRWD